MLTCQRDLFSLDKQVSFLNCAYMSPQLKAVTAAGQHALVRKENPQRITVDDFFAPLQRVKTLFGNLVDAPADRVAFIPSVSYGMAVVALNLPLAAGQEILVVEDQFPSNYYPWARLAAERGARLRVVAVEEGADKGRRLNEALLEAIGARTALVAISHVHWSQGIRFDLAALRQRTREVGSWLVVDGTQSVGALPFSVAAIQPDALVVAAYKWMMGPYATGLAYFGPELEHGRPVEENWINRLDSHNFRSLVNYQEQYQPGAGRFSMGEQSNFVLMPMLEAALQQLTAWGIPRIQDYCRRLNEPFINELQSLGVKLLPGDQRAHHLLALGLPAVMSLDVIRRKLQERQVVVSVRGASLRVAPNVYNQPADWERLLAALRAAAGSK
jgi:selenocysteine lyase/cysteine desulfurase